MLPGSQRAPRATIALTPDQIASTLADSVGLSPMPRCRTVQIAHETDDGQAGGQRSRDRRDEAAATKQADFNQRFRAACFDEYEQRKQEPTSA